MNNESPYRTGGREVGTLVDASADEVALWDAVYVTALRSNRITSSGTAVGWADYAVEARRARFGRR